MILNLERFRTYYKKKSFVTIGKHQSHLQIILILKEVSQGIFVNDRRMRQKTHIANLGNMFFL